MASSPLLGSLAQTIGRGMSSVFLDATLTRHVVPDSPAYDPADPPAPVPIVYTCKAIEEEYSVYTRANDLVGVRDVKVLILASTLAVDPLPLDSISVNGRRAVTVVPAGSGGMRPVSTDPARATWSCRCQS